MFYGYNGFGAFGADIVFNADQVWADQVAGSPKSAGGGGDNARGNKWANMMRAALNDVGNYGLAIPGGQWGSPDISAWKDFASKHGLPVQPFPTREGLVVLEQAIGDGGKITSATSEKGVIITTGQSKAGPSTAGLTGGQMAIVAVGALAIIGGLAFFAKKKKAGVAGKSGALALHSGGKHHANRRRRARRNGKVVVAGVPMSREAAECVEEAGVDVASDVRALRGHRTSASKLLKVCLEGAAKDRRAGWRDYVHAVSIAARKH